MGSGQRALTPLERTPLYERLIERLRAHVDEAGLSRGDRLPPERQLAQQLEVSRATVRQAIVVLEVQGFVEVRHGGGTFLLRDDLHSAPLAQLVALKRRLPDILDAREALECKLAELAARRRTANDLERIESALAAMTEEVASGDPGELGDAAFHSAIASAAHSALLAEMYAGLAQDISASRHESLSQPERPELSLRQHRAIARAVRKADPPLAAKAMRAHLESVRNVKLLSWEPPTDTEATSAEVVHDRES